MYERLTWKEIRFLTNFRTLNGEQQQIVKWLMDNMGLLKRLIPVKHVLLCDLHEIMDVACQRNDNWMIALADNALFRKQSGEHQRGLPPP